MQKQKIEVLLSTYNGGRFLQKQLSSIDNQSIGSVHLTIRDDGSTDDTRSILRNFCFEGAVSTCIEGENVGVVVSFLSLLKEVGSDIDFVAFSDQDDVWHKKKLEVAVEKLSGVRQGYPAMYCCRTRLVDEDLKFIGYGHKLSKPTGLENAILQNIATGCTIVLNRVAINLLQKHFPNTDKVLMHDWWVYLVVSAFGEVIFDDNAYIDYRQHEENVIGVRNGLRFWRQRLARLLSRDKNQLLDQVGEFFKLYEADLPEKQRKLCLDFLNECGSSSFIDRLLYAIKAPVYRQSTLDDGLFRVLLIIGVR